VPLFAAENLPEDMSGHASIRPDTDHLFDALAHGYRRAVLRRLLATGETQTLSDLVTALRPGYEPADTDDPSRWLELQLYHVHVPKLRDAGLVTIDAEYRVAATTAADRAEPFLSVELAAEPE
jgi:hypothetical protein